MAYRTTPNSAKTTRVGFFRRLSSLIRFLTLDRACLFAFLTMVLGSVLVISTFITIPGRIRDKVDFPAFYNAGRILNEYSGARLYDRELQHALYMDVAPTSVEDSDRLFTYTPFFALIFTPLAKLPYLPAFILWIFLSLILFIFAFRLSWTAAGLPRAQMNRALILAGSYLPFFSWCLLLGQTSAFGLFFLALAIFFDVKDRKFISGCSLAMLWYKPPLLLVFVPMLVFTGRWRTLAGFITGTSLVAITSFAVVGYSGLNSYWAMLTYFAHVKSTGGHVTLLEIDLFSFFFSLTGGMRGVTYGLWIASLIIVGPFLLRAWHCYSNHVWAPSITWTLVLNFYVLIYDASLIIPAVVLTAGLLGRVPVIFRWLLLMLFLVPWVETYAARTFGFQPMTVIFILFGCYQFSLLLTERDRSSRQTALQPV